MPVLAYLCLTALLLVQGVSRADHQCQHERKGRICPHAYRRWQGELFTAKSLEAETSGSLRLKKSFGLSNESGLIGPSLALHGGRQPMQ
jgi:hypothetical protein